MQVIPRKIKNNSHLLFYLCLLTSFFILLEISLFLSVNELYLGDVKLVAHHLKIPLAVLPPIIYFMAAELLLHVLFVLFIMVLTQGISALFYLSLSQKEYVGVGLWIGGIIFILLANQFFYPNSKFTLLTSFIAHFYGFKFIFYFFTLIFCLVIFLAVVGFIRVISRKVSILFFVLGMIIFSIYFFKNKEAPSISASSAQPNIILIGIDALRPDFLSFFGANVATPHLDHFLNGATVFSEALTPLARTYPGWISILTGEYPKQHGARFDLASTLHYDLTQTLPAILKSKGYETIFATDEARFSNIDKSLGFDKVISPPMGFNDFLLGTLNDFPLSNLAVNTVLGKYLFPQSYANRAAYITYNPNSFSDLLNNLLTTNHSKPLFLAVHFCLPHLPYIWADYPASPNYVKNYSEAVKRVDKQINLFLKQLKNNKFLEHSIVILLSDHGEAIELSGDRITDAELYIRNNGNARDPIPKFYPPSAQKEAVNQSAGHGTDVLGLTQYHSVLAIHFFGLQGQSPKIVSGVASLLDIKPTLLAKLNIASSKENGVSLLSFLSGKGGTLTHYKDFFMESDFSPEAVRSVHPELRKVLFEGINFYELNPLTLKFTVKKPMADIILSSKQYAVVHSPWILALYPKPHHCMVPILVNLETGEWTNNLDSKFAESAPVAHMLAAMKNFFGKDISNVKSRTMQSASLRKV